MKLAQFVVTAVLSVVLAFLDAFVAMILIGDKLPAWGYFDWFWLVLAGQFVVNSALTVKQAADDLRVV